MDLFCYVRPEWKPRIRPASPRRDWMDATADSFAYRCLPINIANSFGWEVLCPAGFEARWDGGAEVEAVQIKMDPGTTQLLLPLSLFGHGILTFPIEGLFRTSPGWNLWVEGPPNAPKDAISPLGGAVETDWSPYTFTMNWKFTRAGKWVRFEENEPICFFFPVERGLLETVEPQLLPMEHAPEVQAQFEAWSASRLQFHQQLTGSTPLTPADRWQKSYYRGFNPDGTPGAADHRLKLRINNFAGAEQLASQAELSKCPVAPASEARPRSIEDLDGSAPSRSIGDRRNEWLLEAMEQQRQLSVEASSIHLRENLDAQAFLDQYYAPGRPAILRGEMGDWPAVKLWQANYLRGKVGAAPLTLRKMRSFLPNQPHEHDTIDAPVDQLLSPSTAPSHGPHSYAIFGAGSNEGISPVLRRDLRFPSKFLAPSEVERTSIISLALAGAFTPLHRAVVNIIHAQITGRERFSLFPPSESPKLYEEVSGISQIGDITDPQLDFRRFPRARSARRYDLVVEAGDMLFIPLGWWHQATSITWSAAAQFTGFRWTNKAVQQYPLT